MVIYLYGPDWYRRTEKFKELFSQYRGKHPAMDVCSVDLESNPDDWKTVRDFLSQPSMFTDAKIALVREATSVDGKEWIKVLKSHLETPKTFILISDSCKKPVKAFSFLLAKPAVSQEFPALESKMREAFFYKEAKARGLSFAPDAWRFFAGFANGGESVGAGMAELLKLELANFNQPISLSDVRSVIKWFSRDEVFHITRQLTGPPAQAGYGDWRQKIIMLERMFLQREAGAHIFNSLAYQVHGADAVRLADYDVSIKSGGLEYEEALLAFVLK
ncbi:MAG: hypothetical protein Q7R98_01475 [Candidatus Jorgensenbacteria bacterium]|nr:hypothetical protein [Candidatus Jorgensenbacteria bacterium]